MKVKRVWEEVRTQGGQGWWVMVTWVGVRERNMLSGRAEGKGGGSGEKDKVKKKDVVLDGKSENRKPRRKYLRKG